MRRFFASVAVAAAFCWATAAAKEPPFVPPKTLDELDARIAEAVAASAAPGAQVVLVDAGGASWAKAYGYLNKEKTRPAENDSVFRAGSISKSFTGVLAQMLVEDGTLDLGETLRDAAPEIEFTNKWEETDPVVLADLSEHTTGWDDIQFSEYRDFGAGAAAIDGIAFNPKSRTSRWKPGTYPSYNNVGPAILGYVMEKKTGRSFDELMSDRIFNPLGMENSSFLLTEGIEGKISNSYSPGGVREPYVHIGMRPAGSLNCSASELAKFVALLIRRGDWGGAQLVSPEGVSRIETPTRSLAARNGLSLGYGLGVLGTPTKSDGVMYGHNGGIDGFAAEYGYFRDSGTGYVFMMNAPDFELFEKLRSLTTGYLRAQSPSSVSASAVADPDMKRYEGFYRQLSPRSEFSRVLTDAFDFYRVDEKDGALVVAAPIGPGEVNLMPLGDGLFTTENGTAADRVFVATPEGGMLMLRHFQAAYGRIGALEAYWPPALFAATALGGALAVFTSLFWALLRPFGFFKQANRWRVWTWPFLGFAALVATVVAFGMGGSDSFSGFVNNLGQPSLYTLTIAGGTAAIPLFAALGLLAAVAAPRVAGVARLLAGYSSLTLAALSVYLWLHGWIGMTVWSYQPRILGQ